ncbi:MAG: hypothetical protein R3F11_17630 [Verrucomicrobiales bacterium]
MRRLPQLSSSFRARKISAILSSQRLPPRPRAILTNCWVIVEAPDDASPSWTAPPAARASARTSTPPWSQNRLSSAASVALTSGSGISSSAKNPERRIPSPPSGRRSVSPSRLKTSTAGSGGASSASGIGSSAGTANQITTHPIRRRSAGLIALRRRFRMGAWWLALF